MSRLPFTINPHDPRRKCAIITELDKRNTAMKNIIIYTIHPDEWPCEYCDKAKAWLSERGYGYTEQPLYADERETFYKWHGLVKPNRTMPQIFIDGVRIGGFTELVKMEDL